MASVSKSSQSLLGPINNFDGSVAREVSTRKVGVTTTGGTLIMLGEDESEPPHEAKNITGKITRALINKRLQSIAW